jgi:hypothetical protein
MGPEDRARWDLLKGGRRTADFVRHLLDLEEEHEARTDAAIALVRMVEVQSLLPDRWEDEHAWEYESPDTAERAVLAGAIDMTAPARQGYPVGPA